ncbi:hypothetical protein AQUCO_00400482v1 [Aquilegia coerulea]|uniref:Uncharacterized protein n=1 Tax=Aquilegia coerulea TaxID=218851 RepID=A0A2G5EV56_AQUCA|nr:hypothetical protein AQUCO_00400482v1 [Aquilegia coerulea]
MENPSGLRPLIPWLSLVGIILLQSSSNTISNFPAYSAQLIQLLSISSLQLNSLIVASELGKLLDCFCIIALEHLPLWAMLAIGMVLGSVAYVVQFLFLLNKITYLSYWHLLLLNVLAGNSICWFNTVCSHAAASNFLIDHQTVIALTSTYSGLSGKLYTLLVEAVHGPGARNASTYLILNCLIPIGVGLVFLLLVRDPPTNPIKSLENCSFSFIFIIAAVIGGYAVFDSVSSAVQVQVSPRLRLAILVVIIILPIVVPIGMGLERFKLEKWHNKVICQTSSSDHEAEKDIKNMGEVTTIIDIGHEEEKNDEKVEKRDCVEKDEHKGQREKIQANELGVKELLLNVDFWLYFVVNACGSTLIMAYFNNLGRISKSRAQADAPFLLAISSSFGFFGRLSTAMFDWFTRGRNILPRPASMVVLMVLMTGSYFLLLYVDNHCLYVSTAILGVCSGILATITSTITSDLFGSKNSGMSHRIVVLNIPIGVLLYGSLAALNYDREGDANQHCVGFKCFHTTFIIWGSICSLGTVLCFILYLRKRKFYAQKVLS